MQPKSVLHRVQHTRGVQGAPFECDQSPFTFVTILSSGRSNPNQIVNWRSTRSPYPEGLNRMLNSKPTQIEQALIGNPPKFPTPEALTRILGLDPSYILWNLEDKIFSMATDHSENPGFQYETLYHAITFGAFLANLVDCCHDFYLSAIPQHP